MGSNNLMNKLLIALCLSLYFCVAHAQTAIIDSLYNAHNQELVSLRNMSEKMNSVIVQQGERIKSSEAFITSQQRQIDSLQLAISNLSKQLEDNSTDLEKKVTIVRDESLTQSAQINKKVSQSILWWLLCFLVSTGTICGLYLILRKKINRSTKAMQSLSARQEKAESEAIKLDQQLLDLLSAKVSLQQSTKNVDGPDHSLALKVADEIVRIETNLSRMDSSIRGYKQLSASVRRIKDNFAANGYEFVDMLGKPYHEGMKVIANFVPDETLPENAQVITGIIKPQINYNGVMIQAAQITVSQNV